MTQVLRKLLQSKPNEWEEMIPYCECLLRVTPLQSLGGRSPYQVVTGLIPRLPRAVMAGQASGAVSVDEYADRLVGYLQSAYKDIYRRQAGDREEQESEDEQRGRISAELQVGDVVVVKLPPTQSRTGPKRFTARTRAQMWRVYKKAGPNTQMIVRSRTRIAIMPQISSSSISPISSWRRRGPGIWRRTIIPPVSGRYIRWRDIPLMGALFCEERRETWMGS